MSKVFLTGATGFIGCHVLQYFCEQQVEVGCLVRKESNLTNLQGLPVKLHYGCLEDLSGLTAVLKSYDFVIHIAGLARDWGEYEDFIRVNVEGSINLIKACIANGIRDVIFTGTNAVYGEANFPGVKDESFPHQPHYKYFGDKIFPCKLNFYRDSKNIAKELVTELAKSKGINMTVLEPVWVYGEREFQTGFYEYLKTVQSGVPFLPGSHKNKFHVIYARDLARAYWLAYLKKLSGVNCFIIGNSEAEFMEKIYTLFCQEAGFKKPGNVPKALVYPVALILELVATVFRSKSVPLLTRGRVKLFYDNCEYSTQKAERILGFKNEYDLEKGIAKTVQWYQEQKLI